ncbi:MAG: TIGR04282 family arsenosugar biosynthesis glycosyltransferase [Rhodocyclaceae bacterium]|nr:TIGR04282 family arsenosugar biosynthesis glycosyltransferase [Rhodocyclaceae bacterium]
MANSPVKTDVAGAVGVAILARAPIPGQVKTRLIPALGSAGAARFQHWLLQRTVHMALAADIGPVSLWCDGAPRHPDFAVCHSFERVTVRQQVGDDLGMRMLTALQESPNPQGTLVIGTDCPVMTARHLHLAAQSLRDHDAVVMPAEDGGYVLIGMKTPDPRLFQGITWGSEQVMAQTRLRLSELGWRWAEPVGLWDVDRPADFERLAALMPGLRADLLRQHGDRSNSP